MINSLYSIFGDYWSEDCSVWVIGDTHFGDDDREVMGYNLTEEEQVELINKTINPNDTLIILGDVGKDYAKYVPMIRANTKVLVRGNHDLGQTKYERVWKNEIIEYGPNTSKKEAIEVVKSHYPDLIYKGSSEVNDMLIMSFSNDLFDDVYEILTAGPHLILSHERVEVMSEDEAVMFNICGHHHDGLFDDGHTLCVASNLINHTPLNLGKLIKDGLLSEITDIHRLTVARAEMKKKWKEIQKERIKRELGYDWDLEKSFIEKSIGE